MGEMEDMEVVKEVERERKWEDEQEGKKEEDEGEGEEEEKPGVLGKILATTQSNTAARRSRLEVASLVVVVRVVLVGNCRELALAGSKRQSCLHVPVHLPPEQLLLHASRQSFYAACDAAFDFLRFCMA